MNPVFPDTCHHQRVCLFNINLFPFTLFIENTVHPPDMVDKVLFFIETTHLWDCEGKIGKTTTNKVVIDSGSFMDGIFIWNRYNIVKIIMPYF